MHVLLYILVSGCFYSFLSCYIIFFIICFISSSERKGQELHYSTWKTRRMRCIFNTLSILLAENREIYSFFSLFSPPLHKCVSHHFRGTISPKLLFVKVIDDLHTVDTNEQFSVLTLLNLSVASDTVDYFLPLDVFSLPSP